MVTWSKDDSVDAEIKYDSKQVLEFIDKRFPGEDVYDFEKKNSFHFAVILEKTFPCSIIWDNLNRAFYAGCIGDTKAVLYNIKGMELVDDPFRLMALEYFYYESDLYDTISEEFVK